MKIIIFLILIVLVSIMFFSSVNAQNNDKKYFELIIGEWGTRLPNKTELILLFKKQNQVLVEIVNDKNGKIIDQQEFYFSVKNQLLLTFLLNGERLKAKWIKSLNLEKMEIVDITNLQKNGDLTEILELLKNKIISIPMGKIITFQRISYKKEK